LLLQILTHTPPWVFGLFFGLLYLGFLQSRARVVSRPRLAILPAAMLCLSFLGTLSSFGPGAVALVAWATGLLTAVGIGLVLSPPRGVAYSPGSKRYSVPGSWLPLALMMGIFFTKYAVAVARVVAPHGFDSPATVAAICAVYGLFSGIFLARALRVARCALPRTIALMEGASA
jgi:hypothetical protein